MSAKTRRSRRVEGGFTLIELMSVVAIIGLLASIALPSYRGFITRAKRTERTLMIENMRRSALATYNERNKWENDFGGGFSYSSTGYNPVWVGNTGSTKRPWDPAAAGWSYIGFQPLGDLRYSYSFFAETSGEFQYIQIETLSDVDDDGFAETHIEEWQIQSGEDNWTRTYLYDYPSED